MVVVGMNGECCHVLAQVALQAGSRCPGELERNDEHDDQGNQTTHGPSINRSCRIQDGPMDRAAGAARQGDDAGRTLADVGQRRQMVETGCHVPFGFRVVCRGPALDGAAALPVGYGDEKALRRQFPDMRALAAAPAWMNSTRGKGPGAGPMLRWRPLWRGISRLFPVVVWASVLGRSFPAQGSSFGPRRAPGCERRLRRTGSAGFAAASAPAARGVMGVAGRTRRAHRAGPGCPFGGAGGRRGQCLAPSGRRRCR